jgi:hypothetical protein
MLDKATMDLFPRLSMAGSSESEDLAIMIMASHGGE